MVRGEQFFFFDYQIKTTSKNISKKGEISPIYVGVTLIGKLHPFFFNIQTHDPPFRPQQSCERSHTTLTSHPHISRKTHQHQLGLQLAQPCLATSTDLTATCYC
jgi:hypothetical protein